MESAIPLLGTIFQTLARCWGRGCGLLPFLATCVTDRAGAKRKKERLLLATALFNPSLEAEGIGQRIGVGSSCAKRLAPLKETGQAV